MTDKAAAATRPQRRVLRFESLDDILADAERMASSPHVTVGNWSLGQILDHLARGSDALFDGFGFQAPWLARALLAPLVKKRVLNRSMPAGFRLPARGRAALVSESPVEIQEGLAQLQKSLRRFDAESPDQPHPFLGRLTRDEAIRLQLRHAELHLSFVVSNSP